MGPPFSRGVSRQRGARRGEAVRIAGIERPYVCHCFWPQGGTTRGAPPFRWQEPIGQSEPGMVPPPCELSASANYCGPQREIDSMGGT